MTVPQPQYSHRWRVDPRGYFARLSQRTTIDVFAEIRPGIEAAMDSCALDLEAKHFVDAGLAVIADRWALP